MNEFIKRHNFANRILALVLAACLWFIVMKSQNPMRSPTYKDVPIQITGADQLLEMQGLAVIDGQNQKLSLTVKGLTSELTRMNKKDIKVAVDVSGATEAGIQEFSYTVSLPQNIYLSDGKPEKVQLTLDHMVSKTIPVEAELAASAPDGYKYEAPHPVTEALTITGPQTVLDTIETAHITVPNENLTESGVFSYEYVLWDADGNEVKSPYISCETDKISVRLGVYKTAEVPLRVRLIPSADITEDMATVTISPSTVEVYGSAGAIGKLRYLQLDPIDLATVQTGAELSKSIPFPDGIKPMPDQPVYAKVTLQVDGMSSRVLKTSDIHLTDTNTAETKPEVSLENGTIVEVELRGKNSVLTTVTASDLRVTATYDSSLLADGVNQVPITVTLQSFGNDVTIIKYTPEIPLTVKTQQAETTPPPADVPEQPQLAEGEEANPAE